MTPLPCVKVSVYLFLPKWQELGLTTFYSQKRGQIPCYGCAQEMSGKRWVKQGRRRVKKSNQGQGEWARKGTSVIARNPSVSICEASFCIIHLLDLQNSWMSWDEISSPSLRNRLVWISHPILEENISIYWFWWQSVVKCSHYICVNPSDMLFLNVSWMYKC